MYFIKNFLSHVLAIILFIGVLFFTITLLTKELITYDNIYQALEKSELLDAAIQKNNNLKQLNLSEELLQYVEIDDLFYHYVSNKFLYEAKIIEKDLDMNIEILNQRIASGLQKYIDDKYVNDDLDLFLKENNIDTDIKEEIEKYIERNISIDFSDNKYITYEEVNVLYDYVEDSILDVRDRSYIFELIEIVSDKKIQLISLIATVASFLLIAIINFNIVTAIVYTIAPFAINAIIYLIAFLVSSNLQFTGNLTAEVINFIKDIVSEISFKYFIIFILLTFLSTILYFIVKKLNIKISHKTGKTTLDTFFDDYDSDEVVKKLNEEELNEDKEEK